MSGAQGLNIYLGEELVEEALLRREEYGLSLADFKCRGGSINDHILQVVTYEYAPHKTQDLPGTHPPARSYGIMQLPVMGTLPPLRQWGPG